jgi:hypothetical protein
MTRRLRRSIVIALALLVLLGPGAIELYTDWLWFGETGYQTTFLRILMSRSVLGIAAAALAFLVLLVNMRFALRRFSPRQLVFTTREGPISVAFDPHLARTASVVAVSVLALVLGLYASSQWLDWLLFLHAQPFGDGDPVLGHDAGFYVFRLPLLAALSGFLMVLVVLTGLATAAVYVLTRSLHHNPVSGVQVAAPARQHLAILTAVSARKSVILCSKASSVVSVNSLPLSLSPGTSTSASTIASASSGGRLRASAVARNSLRMYDTVFSSTGWAGPPGAPVATGVAAPRVPPFGHRDRRRQGDEHAGRNGALVDKRYGAYGRPEQCVTNQDRGIHPAAKRVDLQDDGGCLLRRSLFQGPFDERR